MQKNELTSKFIDHTFIKRWSVLFLLTLIFYSHFIFYFLWANHDWAWVKEQTPLFSGLFEGRFSQFILQSILTEQKILPIITIITALLFYSLGISLILKIANLTSNKIYYILIGLFATTSPYVISWLYFAFITLSCLSWPFFIILGFILIKKSNSSKYPLLLKLLATLLFLLSLGGYPPSISLIGILFFATILQDICFNKLNLKTTTKNAICYFVSISISVALLLIIQHYLKKYNLQFSTYNTKSLELNLLPQKLYDTFIVSINQFTITTNFIPFIYKYLNLCLSLLAVLCLYNKLPKTLSHISLFIISIFGILLSSTITTLISQNSHYVTYEPRIEFYGIFYIYLLSAIVLIKYSNQFIKNITTLGLCILIFSNINNLSYASKTWKLGFIAETNLMNRITTHIENKENFNPLKKYTFVQGGVLNFRERYYTKTQNEQTDSYTLSAPYIPWHLPSKAYKFYTQTDYFGPDFDVYWSYIDKNEIKMTQSLYDYLTYKAKPWPNSNSIYIDDNTIILTLTTDGKWRAEDWVTKNY